MPDSLSVPSIYTETVVTPPTQDYSVSSDASPISSTPVTTSRATTDQIISRSYPSPSSGGSGGPGFSVQDGVGIATSLIPLVALFKGSGSKHKTPTHRAVQRRQIASAGSSGGVSNQTKMALLIGGGIIILGIGAIVISRK